ncbi:MAG: hypothetical protein ABEH65_04525 [Halobacteriales archaeon]
MVEPAIFGPIDRVLGMSVGGGLLIEYLILLLVLVNLVTRFLAHRTHVKQAEDGADAISRHSGHQATNVLLILASFYYLTLHPHAGMVLSVLVVGMFLTDFFEFESRKVEARQDLDIERPKSSLLSSLLVLGYAAFISLFFVIEPLWSMIV